MPYITDASGNYVPTPTIQRILVENRIALAAVEAHPYHTTKKGTMPERTHTHAEMAETAAQMAAAVKMEINSATIGPIQIMQTEATAAHLAAGTVGIQTIILEQETP